MIQLDSYFSNGLVQPPTSLCMVHTCLHESHGENHVGTFRIIEPIRVFTSDSATATARAAVDGNGESTCGNCEVVQSGWNRHCTVSTNNVEVMTSPVWLFMIMLHQKAGGHWTIPFQSQTKVAGCVPRKNHVRKLSKATDGTYNPPDLKKIGETSRVWFVKKKDGRKNLRTLWYTSPAGIPTVDGRNPIPNHLGCIEPCKQVCCAGWCWIWVLRALWRRWGSTLRAQVFRCRSQRCRGPRRGTPPCALLGSS